MNVDTLANDIAIAIQNKVAVMYSPAVCEAIASYHRAIAEAMAEIIITHLQKHGKPDK